MFSILFREVGAKLYEYIYIFFFFKLGHHPTIWPSREVDIKTYLDVKRYDKKKLDTEE